MGTVRYYDPEGKVHTVRTEWLGFGGFAIFLDGKLYAQADDSIELDDAVRELVAYKKFTHTRPKKAHKNTPPVPASKRAE